MIINAHIEAKAPDNGWQDVDIVLPDIGRLIITRQGNGSLTLWGINWDEKAQATLSEALGAL